MAELADDDPRLDEFTKGLMAVLGTFVGEELSIATMHQIDYAVTSESVKFKRTYGYDIPKLAVLVLPSSRHIALFRADLASEQIYIMLLNMLREFAVRGVAVDKRELAIAIRHAWPHYDPPIEVLAKDGQGGKALIH